MGQPLFHSEFTLILWITVACSTSIGSPSVVLEAANMSVRCCNGAHFASSVIF